MLKRPSWPHTHILKTSLVLWWRKVGWILKTQEGMSTTPTTLAKTTGITSCWAIHVTNPWAKCQLWKNIPQCSSLKFHLWAHKEGTVWITQAWYGATQGILWDTAWSRADLSKWSLVKIVCSVFLGMRPWVLPIGDSSTSASCLMDEKKRPDRPQILYRVNERSVLSIKFHLHLPHVSLKWQKHRDTSHLL